MSDDATSRVTEIDTRLRELEADGHRTGSDEVDRLTAERESLLNALDDGA